MVRFMVLAASLLVVAGASNVAARDDAEVKRLKEKIELLEAKLELAKRDIADLKKENDALKAGGAKGGDAKPAADDGFGVGAKFTGTNRFSMNVNGKKVDDSVDVELEITKRSGKDFTAEFWGGNRKSGLEVKGTKEGAAVKFKVTKTLTNDLNGRALVDNWTFSGTFEKGKLTGTSSKPKTPEQGYKGNLKFEVADKE